ncbi:PREDICTED: 39S ribosomal protein L41, mitochondrial [Ceratosolen solmsi marchali]|uniref:39S ribosomal protein L41, mitochondrial n=1 Tax=Ceratosolen solmsi marchali TaxID=326594 RepID=A0AAJ7DUL3_9HYME|nr:PREDICTED: 39S ribosomal protein L41, mitochondrial [Ceratosolen solmsi marchali]
MTMINLIISRGFLSSSSRYGKRIFTKFLLYNKKGTKLFKQKQAVNPDSKIYIEKRGVKNTGYKVDDRFLQIPEMIPEIIVPNLKGFKLKPYISYKCENVSQSKFTAKDLFNAIYREKIIQDFNTKKLDVSGQPFNPSKEEQINIKEARKIASKPGSDIYTSSTLPLGTLLSETLK